MGLFADDKLAQAAIVSSPQHATLTRSAPGHCSWTCREFDYQIYGFSVIMCLVSPRCCSWEFSGRVAVIDQPRISFRSLLHRCFKSVSVVRNCLSLLSNPQVCLLPPSFSRFFARDLLKYVNFIALITTILNLMAIFACFQRYFLALISSALFSNFGVLKLIRMHLVCILCAILGLCS